jgi:two-component sensor histidine kinase
MPACGVRVEFMQIFGRQELRPLVDAALSKLRERISPNSLEAYAFAFACLTLAALLEFWLLSIDQEISPLETFYPAVLFAALIGGVGPGVMAAVISGLVTWWALMPPRYTLFLAEYSDKVTLVIYAFASVLIIWGADYFRSLSKRLEDEERFRKLAVEELAHRLRNKMATIQAIIAVQLRDNKKIRDDILDRLMALSVTDELIEQAHEEGACLHDIAAAELGPYAASRVTIAGANVLLPPKQALTMALLVHELATNSAKYGALSTPDGRLSVISSLSHAVLHIEWRESDGPVVSQPLRRGFGLRLLERALEQFQGRVETRFEPTGLICKMSLRLTHESKVGANGNEPDKALPFVHYDS